MTREESPIHLLAIMLGGMVESISAPLFFAAQIGIFLPFRTWGQGPLPLGKNSAQIYQIGKI